MRLLPIIALLLLAPVTHALDATPAPVPAVKAAAILKTGTSWNGAPLVFPQGPAEVNALVIDIAVGGETGWHKHPVPSFAYIVEGQLEVSLKDGSKKLAKPGDAFAEVVDVWHNGRVVGDKPVKLVVFYTGAAGSALTIKADADHQH
ncbi:hypothetical protein IGB42_00956 [Andreprevotia sp. IGB-42]|uniref:cupin domain-containing protein n=1 Tax=Andreprevotia sp. IGB-42 TaxID=2497473 RepID=UPI00135A827C|nr:cupin domain-containing protein [Andreprevotia sp. IGB-42]KAF0814900.1 hypothetical protein IGB42_00956 [Andreprevotia sp. IGB-42]